MPLPTPTLRQHLILLVVASAIPAIALIVYSAVMQYADLRQRVADQTTELAHHIASEQERLIADTRHRLEVLASLPEIARRDFAGCSRRFAEQLQLLREYSNFLFATPDGKVVCSGVDGQVKSGQANSTQASIADRALFQQTLKTYDFGFALNPETDVAGGRVFSMSAAALNARGRIVGVLVASVPMSWYSDSAKETGVPAGYRMTVLDRDMNVLARNPADEWIGKNIGGHPLAVAVRAADRQGTAEADGLHGRPYFFAFNALRDDEGHNKVYVVLGAPVRELYADARTRLAHDLLALLFVVVAIIFGASFGANRLVLRHVHMVIAAARRFTGGDHAVRIADEGGSREIVRLKRIFNETAAMLREQIGGIERLNRLNNVSSAINRTIVRLREPQALLDEVCLIAVDVGGFAVAWVGVADTHSRTMHPRACAGIGREVIESWKISSDPEDPMGQGMSATALRRNAPVVINDKYDAPSAAPWRERLAALGLRSGAAFPIRVEGKPEAVLSLYARDPGFFDEQEIRLLQELAGDTGLALELMQKQERLQELKNFDRLTGLPNRWLYEDRLAQAIKRVRYHERNIGLMLVRINRFRQINDVAGWLAGDAVLRAVAAYLQSMVREGDTVARHGDNEYAIILADVGTPEDVMAVTDKVLEGFPRVVPHEDGEIIVSVSAGIAIYPTDGGEARDLMQKAQSALDSLSGNGKTTFAFYSTAVDERAHERHRIESRLFHALERNELTLHFQPIVAVASRQTRAAETLLRWTSPELGSVSPALFVPIAEETGLIVPLGYWVLEQACRQLRAWRDRGLPQLKLGVNVSVVQLREPDFLERVAHILEKTGFDPATTALGIEITESELMHNVDHAVTVLHGLRRMGIPLSIDDFGTGYSSLSYLRELPIQTLKVDASFIRKLATNSDAAAITRGIIALAHGLGVDVVAEGVETEQQLAVLQRFGCDAAQGFLFSPGIPAEEFVGWLRRNEARNPLAVT